MPWVDDLRDDLGRDLPPAPGLDELTGRVLARRRRNRARFGLAGVALVATVAIGGAALRPDADPAPPRFEQVGSSLPGGASSTTAAEPGGPGLRARIVEPAPPDGYPVGSTVTVEVTGLAPGTVFHVAACTATPGSTVAADCDHARVASLSADARGIARASVAVPATLATDRGARPCGACRLWVRPGGYPAAFGQPGLPTVPASGTAPARQDLFVALPVAR